MAAISNSLISVRNPPPHLSPGSSLKPLNQFLGNAASTNLLLTTNRVGKLQLCTSRRPLIVQAGYSDRGRPGSGSIFVGGFILGGLIVGTLSCVYAPQISKALAGPERKDLMRKLPKFIYDEEKALERTRKILADKIAQLNSAIDDVSGQLKPKDAPNDVDVISDEVEAAI
ncbi:Localized to the inner membrane of the chloroplast [Fagus crenata]